MFPVSVCFCIESKRFVEEETQRKRLGSLRNESRAGLAIFRRRNQDGRALPSEVEGLRTVTVRLLRGIPRLRFAPLGMTRLI